MVPDLRRQSWYTETSLIVSQTFTFIDPAGNQAQYTVHEMDHRSEYRWSTDHGDHGTEPTYAQAQERARNVLKVSMTIRRRSSEKYSY
jgi:hypothetical protein